MKNVFFSILGAATLALAACSSQSTGISVGSTSTALPMETQLAAGTLKLADTDQAVSVEQAKELVVYWDVYKELSQSQTAAQAEVDGLITQIQETMTSEQMQAITDMQITQQDVVAAIHGVTVASDSASESTVSLPFTSSSGGTTPAGGPPADGGVVPPDGGMPADMTGAAPVASTSQSTQAGSNSAVTIRVPSALVDAVIQSLQQKIAA